MATVSLGDTGRKACSRVAVGIGGADPDFDDRVAHRINTMAVSPSHRGTSWSRMKRKDRRATDGEDGRGRRSQLARDPISSKPRQRIAGDALRAIGTQQQLSDHEQEACSAIPARQRIAETAPEHALGLIAERQCSGKETTNGEGGWRSHFQAADCIEAGAGDENEAALTVRTKRA
jgi:hypothetical protein